jgi:hypothetical protein
MNSLPVTVDRAAQENAAVDTGWLTRGANLPQSFAACHVAAGGE